VIALLAALSLIFGILGIYFRFSGIVLLPLIAGSLAALIVIDKKKLASLSVAVLLFAIDLVFGFTGYFSLLSLSSIAVALIISIHYTKNATKSDSALYSTVTLAFLIFASAVLYFIGTTSATTLYEAYEKFIEAFGEYKEYILSSISEITVSLEPNEQSEALKIAGEMMDSYIDYVLSLVSVFAFLLVGFSHKLFSMLMFKYTSDTEHLKQWRFLPHKTYAYFYFFVAVLSIFLTKATSVLSVTADNLYFIFLYVFAYVGYKIITSILKNNGRSAIASHLIILSICVAFSSISIPLLAIMGAMTSINPDKFVNLKNNLNDRR
jgi:hypothetical protein